MEKSNKLFLIGAGGLTIIIVVLAGIYQNLTEKPISGPTFSECNTLSAPASNGLNLVFFADAKTTEKYRDYFLKVTPFNNYPDAFNFYYIENYKPACELYKNIALFCHSPELIKKSASCPNDYVIVIDDRESSIRSSSYLNVLSINKKHPLSVLTHELGHAFAYLADEYIPASLSSSQKNCVKNCEQFEGNSDGCYEGCSKNDYIRSIDSGVMRTLNSEKYGKFDEMLLIDNLHIQSSTFLSGSAIAEEAGCSSQQYYLITINHSSGGYSILRKSIETGCPTLRNAPGDATFSTTDELGNELSSSSLNSLLLFTDAPASTEDGEIDGAVYAYEGAFTLNVPVKSSERAFQIKSGQDILLNGLLADIGARACRVN